MNTLVTYNLQFSYESKFRSYRSLPTRSTLMSVIVAYEQNFITNIVIGNPTTRVYQFLLENQMNILL